jgi:hypothetical protein
MKLLNETHFEIIGFNMYTMQLSYMKKSYNYRSYAIKIKIEFLTLVTISGWILVWFFDSTKLVMNLVIIIKC